MLPSHAMLNHREAIRKIVLEQHASNARVFGCVARGEDRCLSGLPQKAPKSTPFKFGSAALTERGAAFGEVAALGGQGFAPAQAGLIKTPGSDLIE